jgi:hypothetical protein
LWPTLTFYVRYFEEGETSLKTEGEAIFPDL